MFRRSGAQADPARPAPEERLQNLRAAEKTIAIFAGVSLIVGYFTLKVAFKGMASRSPPPSSSEQSTTAPRPLPRPLVLAGPSGSGKSTLLKRLFHEFDGSFGLSVSHTTRRPRHGEVDGREYHFTTREKMKRSIEAGDFIEWAEYSGNMYGTSKQAVHSVQVAGMICTLDIDMQGVRSMKKTDLNPVYVLIKPPSLEILERRLRDRNTETEESLQKRLAVAKEELGYGDTPGTFDHVIVNDTVEAAYQKLKDIVQKDIGIPQKPK